MERILKWSSVTAFVLILSFVVSSCKSTTERKKAAEEAEREKQARLIKGELEKANTADEKAAKAKEKERQRREKEAKKKAEEERERLERERKKKDFQICALTIATDKKEYMEGEPIALTITYKNRLEERIRVIGDGHSVPGGFSGEIIVIKRKDFEDSYSFLPKNLKIEEHTIYPMETWSREIKDLEKTLTQDGVAPHRKEKKGEKKGAMKTEKEKALAVLDLPRFQKPDKYTLQVVYYPNRMKNPTGVVDPKKKKKKKGDDTRSYTGPRIVDQKLVSNVVELEIKRKQ